MFWDKISGVYDLFENIYNRKVYTQLGRSVVEFIDNDDCVLECACGTGAISVDIAKCCRALIATDYADGMLARAQKKLAHCGNVKIEKADITNLRFADDSFDKVVAGNVIHLLPNPQTALKELERVCKPGGKLIIPTYINNSADSSRAAVRFLEAIGAKFNRQFDRKTYRDFFAEMGYSDVKYYIVNGRMPCDIAIIDNIKPD